MEVGIPIDLTCKLCHTTSSSRRALTKHITQTHKFDTGEYYKKYINSRATGICEVCKAPTKLISLDNGFRRFCSHKCWSVSPEGRAHARAARAKVKNAPFKGCAHTPETRAYLQSRWNQYLSWHGNPMLGRKHTQESKDLMSLHLKGKPGPRKGKHHTLESRILISKRVLEKVECMLRKYGKPLQNRGKREVPFIGELQKWCPYRIHTGLKLGGFCIPDGYIRELKLLIEYDEPYHEVPAQKTLDLVREQKIKAYDPWISIWRVKEREFLFDPVNTFNEFVWLTQEFLELRA